MATRSTPSLTSNGARKLGRSNGGRLNPSRGEGFRQLGERIRSSVSENVDNATFVKETVLEAKAKSAADLVKKMGDSNQETDDLNDNLAALKNSVVTCTDDLALAGYAKACVSVLLKHLDTVGVCKTSLEEVVTSKLLLDVSTVANAANLFSIDPRLRVAQHKIQVLLRAEVHWLLSNKAKQEQYEDSMLTHLRQISLHGGNNVMSEFLSMLTECYIDMQPELLSLLYDELDQERPRQLAIIFPPKYGSLPPRKNLSVTTPSKARKFTPLKSKLTPGKQQRVLCPETPDPRVVRRKSGGNSSIAETPDEGDKTRTIASPIRQQASLGSRNVQKFEDSFNGPFETGNMSTLEINSFSFDQSNARRDSADSMEPGANTSIMLFPHLLNKKRKREESTSSSSEETESKRLGDELEETEAPVKKKNKNINHDKENPKAEPDVSESESPANKPKKKKKIKDKNRDEEATTQEHSSRKKKKSQNREAGLTVAYQEDNILGTGEVVHSEGDSAKSKKKKEEMGMEKFLRRNSFKEKKDSYSRADENNIPSEYIQGMHSSHENNTLIQDIYCYPEPAIITGQLYNVVIYILNENIPINKVNTFWTHNCQPKTKGTRDYLSKVYNVIFNFFTEEEDEKIMTRLNYLRDNQIITKPKEFLRQLNDQNGRKARYQTKDKSTSNIVGLYVGQDLPNRIAHNVTQRLRLLLTGSSLLNNYKTKSQVKAAETPEGPVYKTKQKLRYWTVEEDKILVETVLKDNCGRGFIPVEEVIDRDINWKEVAESFAELGRTRQMVRERWTRFVKYMLIEGEQDIQERYDYQKSLLEYVIKLGVKDSKEIRWKELAPVFAPKPCTMLRHDLWNLIRNMKNETFTGKLENGLENLKRPGRISIYFNTKRNEAKSQLRDFYSSLLMRN